MMDLLLHAAAMPPLLKSPCQDSLLSHPIAPAAAAHNNRRLKPRQQQQQQQQQHCAVPLAFAAHQSVDKPWSSCRVSSDAFAHQSVDKPWSSSRLSSDGPRGALSDAGKRISALQSFRIKEQPLHLWRHVCTASGQGSAGKAAPDEEDPKSVPEQTPPSERTADSQFRNGGSPVEMDWRAFRAQLVQSEKPGNKSIGAEGSMMPAAKRWAHPILAPEAGCVLIATEKLDGQQNFERTVILLLSPGSNNPREGPYGLILNRPLLQRIKDIKPKDRAWVKHFGNCQAHLGGPMDTEVFLLLHGTSGIKGYQEVIPGVYCGTSEGLEPVAEFAKRGNRSLPQGFRFFFGYSGWGTDQLKKEIAAGLWCVAACSSDLITSTSTSGLWEGVLQLMGGKYLELSKRPRRKQY
ncbi:unnamed protein product [Sphagnum tenellum]